MEKNILGQDDYDQERDFIIARRKAARKNKKIMSLTPPNSKKEV